MGLAGCRDWKSEWKPPSQTHHEKRASRLIRQLPDRFHDNRPARGVKARRALRPGTMVAFHEEVDLLPTIIAEIVFRNKIPETPQRRRLCNGMKSLISDYENVFHLGGTAKPGIQKTLDCRGDFRNLRSRPR